jgi:hypothetical protein
MAFEGELKDLSLGDILQTIQQNRQTGTLTLSLDRNDRARIHFEQGKIALYSPDETPGPAFADVLRRLEAVAEKELALAEKKRGRKGLRTVLEERGLLTPDDYRAAAERYLKDEVADLFLRAKGRFQFQEGDAPRGAFDADLRLARAEVEPQVIAMEGLRRQDEWTRIARQVRSFEDIFTPTRALEAGDGEQLSAEARKLHALLAGFRTLDDCMGDLPCGRFGTGAALMELLAANLVEPANAEDLGERAKDAEKRGEAYEAERLYRCALEIERNNLALREKLAHLLEREGRGEDAGRERTLLGLGRAGDRDLAGAIAEYKRAADLLPQDTSSLERVLELERERRDRGQSLAAGKRLAERFVALKLPGRARDLYRDLVREFPEDQELKARLAETLAELGDKREAAAAWKSLGRMREREKDEQAALFAYTQAVQADHEDKEAAARLELIRSGRLEVRRRRRRRLGRIALATFLASLLALLATRETSALLLVLDRSALALSSSGEDCRSVYADFTRIAHDFPATLAAFQAERLAAAAVRGEVARIDALMRDRQWRDARTRLEHVESLPLSPTLLDEVRAARSRLDALAPKAGAAAG